MKCLCTQAGNAAPHNPTNGAHFQNVLHRSLFIFATDFYPPGLGFALPTPYLPQGCLKSLRWPNAAGRKKKLVCPEQHSTTWSRPLCAWTSYWVGCPCSQLRIQTTLATKLHASRDNAGTSEYFPTRLGSSFSSADTVLLVHIHKCCDLMHRFAQFTHLLHVVNLRSGVCIQMHLSNWTFRSNYSNCLAWLVKPPILKLEFIYLIMLHLHSPLHSYLSLVQLRTSPCPLSRSDRGWWWPGLLHPQSQTQVSQAVRCLCLHSPTISSRNITQLQLGMCSLLRPSAPTQ